MGASWSAQYAVEGVARGHFNLFMPFKSWGWFIQNPAPRQDAISYISKIGWSLLQLSSLLLQHRHRIELAVAVAAAALQHKKSHYCPKILEWRPSA
ncbi:hypothetical protein Zmor_002705 [Zophobas morio]|uniref:Uncharacterized protein n=1 Tax=Zophobas morio TaxID=2755281 RepID=A0AA38HMF3_9CUCU|nr:hypothetical protein Zmor_002705 [Zophobas morio]